MVNLEKMTVVFLSGARVEFAESPSGHVTVLIHPNSVNTEAVSFNVEPDDVDGFSASFAALAGI